MAVDSENYATVEDLNFQLLWRLAVVSAICASAFTVQHRIVQSVQGLLLFALDNRVLSEIYFSAPAVCWPQVQTPCQALSAQVRVGNRFRQHQGSRRIGLRDARITDQVRDHMIDHGIRLLLAQPLRRGHHVLSHWLKAFCMASCRSSPAPSPFAPVQRGLGIAAGPAGRDGRQGRVSSRGWRQSPQPRGRLGGRTLGPWQRHFLECRAVDLRIGGILGPSFNGLPRHPAVSSMDQGLERQLRRARLAKNQSRPTLLERLRNQGHDQGRIENRDLIEHTAAQRRLTRQVKLTEVQQSPAPGRPRIIARPRLESGERQGVSFRIIAPQLLRKVQRRTGLVRARSPSIARTSSSDGESAALCCRIARTSSSLALFSNCRSVSAAAGLESERLRGRVNFSPWRSIMIAQNTIRLTARQAYHEPHHLLMIFSGEGWHGYMIYQLCRPASARQRFTSGPLLGKGIRNMQPHAGDVSLQVDGRGDVAGGGNRLEMDAILEPRGDGFDLRGDGRIGGLRAGQRDHDCGACAVQVMIFSDGSLPTAHKTIFGSIFKYSGILTWSWSRIGSACASSVVTIT